MSNLRQSSHLDPLNAEQVMMLAGCWDLRRGDHPHLAGLLAELPTLPLFPSVEQWREIAALDLPVTLAAHGHHVVRDNGYNVVAGGGMQEPDEWSLAPVWVRDLAGRVIHTGLMPLPTPPSFPLFPVGCMDVTAEAAGAELIENAVFTTFRRLEISPLQSVRLAGQPGLCLRAVYPQPATCTYKLRPDTFYQDGWRLPQVPRLFARPVAAEISSGAAEEFIARWHHRPEGQDYESFYEANGGSSWFDELFLKGVTVIPTLEAYNGRYHVGADYSIEDVDPGRAVRGLHQVIRQQASEFAPGTILEIIQPGYVTATQVFPAQVVVSDGSRFKAPEAPEPLLPDISLPHSRVSSTWGAVWLPSHPQHFAEPALWDWDSAGHFIQVGGPLWDPLHYTYTSIPAIVRASMRPVEGNPRVFKLPESLRNRFHPVVAPTWYDTINERTGQERRERLHHPLHGSSLDMIPMGQEVSSFGYHPLPCGLEYELDPAVFPDVHPRHRVGPCPSDLVKRIAPVAVPLLEAANLARHHVVLTEPMREVLEVAAAAGPSGIWNRESRAESGNSITQLLHQSQMAPAWLPEIPSSHLLVNVKRLFASRQYRQALQKSSPTLAASLYRFREAGLAFRRLRYRLFAKYPAAWVQAWASGLDLATAETTLAQWMPEHHEQVLAVRARGLGVVEAKAVPAGEAPGLRLRSGAARVSLSQRKARA